MGEGGGGGVPPPPDPQPLVQMHQTDVNHVSGFLVTYVSACSELSAWRRFLAPGIKILTRSAEKMRCALRSHTPPSPLRVPSGRGCKTSSKGELHCSMRKSTVPMWERERGVPRFLCLGSVEVFGFNQRRGAGARHNSRSIHPRTQVREHSGGSRRCAHSRHHGIASPHHSHLLIPPSTVSGASGGSGGRSSPGSAWGACGRSTRSIRWPSGCSAASESERVIARRP